MNDKNNWLNAASLLLCSMLVSHYSVADGSLKKESSAVDLSTIKASYKEKKYQQVIRDGGSLLAAHPNDVDVQLYVGLSYYQLKQLSTAQTYFTSILKTHPDYSDAISALARTKAAQQASHKKDTAASHTKHINKHSLKIKDRAHDLKKKPHHVHDLRKKIRADYKSANQSDGDQSIRYRPHFELTGFTSNANVTHGVTRPDTIWDWSSVSLYRKSEYGAFGVGVNYANRQSYGAPQVYINAQPNITENIWLDLTYAQANKPNIYPDNTVVGEGYFALGKGYELSAGEGYRKIRNTYFNTITGSLGSYLGNYYFSFRPQYFAPKAGPDSLLYTLKARRYSEENPDQYIGLVFATGTSPDLFDLLTVTFFKVKNNIFLFEGQQPINDYLLFLYGGGYETQKFPNDFIRRLGYGNIGLKLRFE